MFRLLSRRLLQVVNTTTYVELMSFHWLSKVKIGLPVFANEHDRDHYALKRLESSYCFLHSKQLLSDMLIHKTCTNCQFVGNSHNKLHTVTGLIQPPSFWQKIKSKGLPWKRMRYPHRALKISGYNMFMCCAEIVDYELFFEVFQLPDTFSSWFRITELHIWLCMVRLVSEGAEGVVVRNELTCAMWKDIDIRSKKLGAVSSSSLRDGIAVLADQFKASLIGMDEGVIGDDQMLAGALWRIFFQMKDIDPQQLALMVEYVRKQMAYLEEQSSSTLLQHGLVQFLPLYGDTADHERNAVILNMIYKR